MAWIFPYMDVATPFPRHFHVVFDVASCLLNLSVVVRSGGGRCFVFVVFFVLLLLLLILLVALL